MKDFCLLSNNVSLISLLFYMECTELSDVLLVLLVIF